MEVFVADNEFEPIAKSSKQSGEERELDEQVLIRRVIAGNKDDFRQLVLRHQNVVMAMIMRVCNDREVANDLAQETFVKAYLNISKFRFQASFGTWLVRIALNTTHSYFTSGQYKRSSRTVSLEPDSAHAAADGREQAETEFKLKRLRNAIAQLDQKYRDVMVLCGLEGKSYEEAASILQIPIGTVRSRLNKARLLVKDLLKEDLV